MKLDRDKWQKAFESELKKAEKKQLAKVKRYYKDQYFKGVNSFLSDGQTTFQLLFYTGDIIKIYRDLYEDIGLQFAKWYAKGFDKYIKKGVDSSQYVSQWQNTFAALGSAVGAERVTLVSGTAKATLVKITQQLMTDIDFQNSGIDEKTRILRNQFTNYSTFQAERLVRTEATNAANFATMASAETIFPAEDLQKEWIAATDERTRTTHREANGKVVNQKDTFNVGGSQMLYPGDPRGPAKEVINCRCSIASFPKEDAEATGEISDIGFGLGGGNNTSYGLTNLDNQINNILTNTIENAAFIPAKTLKEIEERMLKFANSVDLNGLTLKKQNDILKGLEDILGKYNVTLRQDIGFFKRKRTSWAAAGYRGLDANNIPTNPLYIRFQKTYSKSADKMSVKNANIFETNKQYRLKQWQDILNRPDLNAERAEYYRNKIEVLRNTTRWSIEGSNSLYTTTVHEAFHSVDYTYGARKIFSEQLIKNGIQRNDWYIVSEYGGSKLGELWAEVGAAIQTNTNIPSGFVKSFEDTLKIIGAI